METAKIRLLVFFPVIFGLVGALFGQNSTVLPPQGDFRVNLVTDRDLYHNRDILALTVELLNESPNAVQIYGYEVDPVPVGDPATAEEVEAVVDGSVVDAVIRPWPPTVIGYARLAPVDYISPLMLPGTDVTRPEIAYRLPLFGSAVIDPHSTRIISTINIWIGCPVIEPAPVPAERAAGGLDGTSVDAERPAVDVAGKYWALRPGRYLVEVTIDKIWGVKVAPQAQKIVRIGPRPVVQPDPVMRLLQDNNATIHKVDERTTSIAQVQQKELMYAIYNSQYIRAIYKLLTGKTLPTPTTTPTSDATTTTTTTRTSTQSVVRTR